ncbi:MAG: TRAP transporter small permease [Flavobacteriaceae bacterium]
MPRFLTGAGRLIDNVEWGADVLAAVSLVIMMLTISMDAIGRFFGAPLQGAYEFTEYYLMVIVAFAALSRSFRTGGQVRLEILDPWLSRIPARLAYRAVVLVSLLAFVLMLWITAPEAWTRIADRDTTFGLIQWPLYLSYVWVPLGVGLLCLRLAYELICPSEPHNDLDEAI